VGDPHEQHADAVADRVVRGESAEPLLDRYSGSGGAPVVQRVWAETRSIEGHEERRWEQQETDEVDRVNGWYHEVDGAWQAVGGSASTLKTKRKHSADKDPPPKHKKQRARDPKLELPKKPVVKDAMTLVEDSEIGAAVLERALAASERLAIIVTHGGTQTRMDYDGDRGGTDTIELSKNRMLVGGAGSVAQQLLMELCNLSNKLRFWETDYDVQQGTLDQDTYVEVNEQIEYEASVLVHQAWTAAQATSQKLQWGKANHKGGELLASWAVWWDHMKRHNQAHLNVYREGWARLRADSAPRMPRPPTRPAPQTLATTTQDATPTTDEVTPTEHGGTATEEVSTAAWSLTGYDSDSS
jgi:hypothetical protein